MENENQVFIDRETSTIKYAPDTENNSEAVNITDQQLKEIKELPSEGIKEAIKEYINKLIKQGK